jgi:trigger factor
MNISVEHQPNCRAVAHIRATRDEVTQQRDSIIANYARYVRLPGYRPGKAPRAVVLKKYGPEIGNELEKDLINDGLRQAVKNEGLDVLNVLAVKDKNHHDGQDGDGSFSFTVEMMLAPRLELPEYKGIPVKLPRIEVTEADIDHDLLHLREHQQKFEEVDRAAGVGDVVQLSYTVSLDGQPVAEVAPEAPEHLRALEDQWFLLDTEEDFLPGFYTSLIGLKKGDEKTFKVDLPEAFDVEALKGKSIEFAATCKGVREKQLPEVNEEFVKKVGGDEMTLESLRGEIKEAVRRRREQARDTAKSNQVLAFLHDKMQFEVPQEIINREAQRRTNDMAMRAIQQGVSQEEIMKQQDQILGSATQQAMQSVRISFILEEVAKKEQIEVGDQQLSYAIANLAARQKMPVKKFLSEARKSGMIDRLREDLRMENALAFLKDNATIEETDPEPEHCETHSKAEAKAEA